MWVARVEEGLVFGGLTASTVETLRGVPMLIESTDERVRDRLLPETCATEDDEQHWREHAVPELERLFLSRATLVRRDLDKMRPIADGEEHVLLIVDEHVNAWIAALNAARLALFALNDMTAAHMEEEGFEAATPKQQQAILRIGLLAEMQAVMLGEYEIGGVGGAFEDLLDD
jgi:hypothetical protein